MDFALDQVVSLNPKNDKNGGHTLLATSITKNK
jgi:hypothetical protein